uniref:Amino acid permease/ SLC12A domain-containing protein n=1 Tax=Globodera rostochiensis TaxID=31243 RepID=A0A914I9P7_GLORO
MNPSPHNHPKAAVVGQQSPPTVEPDSLFSQQSAAGEETPWWQRNFLLQQPTLVNAWNAVFPTVVVNIFGIVLFLRMGWIVGTAGLFQAIVVLALCTLFSSVTVLSAIGICERCQIRSGGIYFLVSHVLGKRIGGAVGLIYTFGQACATSLVALGFGESMAKLAGIFNPVAIKTLSMLVLVILNAMNFVGLRFIIRLQLLLMSFLALAIGDFLLGAVLFTPQDPEAGIGELSAERLFQNWHSHYGPSNCTPFSELPGIEDPNSAELGKENFFSVFGILFANFIGVLAGVNMSGNLADPLRNIAEGELSALGASFALCFLIMLILGASVDR